MNVAVAYPRMRRIETRKEEPAAVVRPRRRAVSLSAKGMMAAVLVSVVLFAALVGLVYVKYMISETQLEINSLNTQIHELNNEKSRLEEKLDRETNIQDIMTRASALGMAQPTSEQILTITLPGDGVQESMALQGD